jgi:stage V sporulation protein SpoVS
MPRTWSSTQSKDAEETALADTSSVPNTSADPLSAPAATSTVSSNSGPDSASEVLASFCSAFDVSVDDNVGASAIQAHGGVEAACIARAFVANAKRNLFLLAALVCGKACETRDGASRVRNVDIAHAWYD